MHRFICLNGHRTVSAAREPNGRCGVDGCTQAPKLILAPLPHPEVPQIERANAATARLATNQVTRSRIWLVPR